MGTLAAVRPDTRVVYALVSALILGAAAVRIAANWPTRHAPYLGYDFEVYRAAAASWLADDGYFLGRQLAGPYEIMHGDVLYPPAMLPLFAAFTVLPAILWYVIPLAIIAWRTRHAPPWTWPLLALCLWWPVTADRFLTGNPVIWLAAGLSLGAGSVALLKPTLLPFALVGIRGRAWWITAGVMAVVSVTLFPLSVEYVGVLLDARTSKGALYSVLEVPILLFPVVLHLGDIESPLSWFD